MKFAKTLKVKSPSRGTSRSAGIDFYIPEFSEEFVKQLAEKNSGHNFIVDNKNEYKYISLQPQQRILIPSGIHIKFSPGYMLAVHNKSGIATKKGLDRLAEIIDEDYSGQIHISIVNTGNTNVALEENEKIIQAILIPVSYAIPEEVEYTQILELHKNSERKDGGFGSTDNK
jgi:dUTP pyrophosphatase